MGVISKSSKYDMDEALEDVELKEYLLDLKTETQVILQLLVKHGIVEKSEVDEMRNTVKNSSIYKQQYDNIDKARTSTNYFKDNPEAQLKLIFEEKMKDAK